MSFGLKTIHHHVAKKVGLAGLVLGMTMAAPVAQAADGEVNIYSMRQAYLIEPILDEFTKETGVKVNVLFANDGLIERLAQEGRNSPADVVLTSSFGNTARLIDEGLAQPVDSETLKARVPTQFRAADNRWFALTLRARLFYTSLERMKDGDLVTYEGLADPKWQGKVCTRSGSHPYNVQMIAAMIAHHGKEDTKTWLEGVKSNLARKPQGNDRAQVKAVSEGECDIAVGNSYYYFKMLDDPEQRGWAEAVRPVFPAFDGGGTHVNVSAMVMAPHAPNPENAVLLMEYLTGETAQRIYADVNFEYPVNPDVAPSEALAGIGKLTPDSLTLDQVASNLRDALQLVAEVGYNE
jgi:iron(III) transport system substrate-binding protein